MGSICHRSNCPQNWAIVAGAIIGGAFVAGAIIAGAFIVGAITAGAIVVGVNVAGAIVAGVNFVGAFVAEQLSRSNCRLQRNNCRRSIYRRSICRTFHFICILLAGLLARFEWAWSSLINLIVLWYCQRIVMLLMLLLLLLKQTSHNLHITSNCDPNTTIV